MIIHSRICVTVRHVFPAWVSDVVVMGVSIHEAISLEDQQSGN